MERNELLKQGRKLRASLKLEPADGHEPVPGYNDFVDEVVFGGVWSRPHLTTQERMLCTLGILAFLPQPLLLKRYVGSALDIDLQPRSILEAFMQSGLYAGYVTTESAAGIAHEVFESRGLAVPAEPDRTTDNEQLDKQGNELMRTLHGQRATQGYGAPDNKITARLYGTAIRYGYGELWSRPGLSHRQRMLIAIASFTAIPLESQLRKFSRSALNIGLSEDNVLEAIVQTAPYTGFPRALNGLAIVSEVFDKS